MTYGILRAGGMVRKARLMMDAFARSAPVGSMVFSRYRPCDVLLVYGLGGANRHQVGMDHVAAGGRLVALDVGYWQRVGGGRRWRVAIDGFHSPQYVMRGPDPGAARFRQAGLKVHGDRRIDGPIMLVGNAPKSNRVGAQGWSARKARELRQAFPGREVLYRAKPKRPLEPGVDYNGVIEGGIDEALRRVSLVVCRHSNVAVDACRLGVPVVCDDGAAAAIYPQSLADYRRQPDFELRREFLHRLAWWQWSMDEGPQFWAWLEGVLEQCD